MQEMLFSLLAEAAYLIAVLAIYFVIQFLRRRISSEDMMVVRDIVEDGVLFVQQIYGHLDGEHKYWKAVEAISEALRKKGIKISEEELQILIEATIQRLKVEWGDLWREEG